MLSPRTFQAGVPENFIIITSTKNRPMWFCDPRRCGFDLKTFILQHFLYQEWLPAASFIKQGNKLPREVSQQLQSQAETQYNILQEMCSCSQTNTPKNLQETVQKFNFSRFSEWFQQCLCPGALPKHQKLGEHFGVCFVSLWQKSAKQLNSCRRNIRKLKLGVQLQAPGGELEPGCGVTVRDVCSERLCLNNSSWRLPVKSRFFLQIKTCSFWQTQPSSS